VPGPHRLEECPDRGLFLALHDLIGHRDDLVGNSGARRYNQRNLVTRCMVWFYDICNPLDTVCFPNGCAAKFH